ncbi:MAG: YggS family pyridoxal phosphate-dependent enzyme [Beijerinckiaceae bacterium]
MISLARGEDASAIAHRYKSVRREVDRAIADAGRAAHSVTLIAVSKLAPPESVEPVLAAGHRVFGENYVQESKRKWPDLRERYPGVELHLIGPLQSNKARDAVQLFDAIQTLDRESLARELAKEIERTGKRPRLFVQVNTGEEPQKGGIAPQDVEVFLELCRRTYSLNIDGLMAIPPADHPPSPHFALLASKAKTLNAPLLSMGMSADFAQAIMLGATHVRIGTAIFGPRPG